MQKAQTTIRIDKKTKDRLENLDFVKKDSFNDIVVKLIEFYDSKQKKN